MRAGIRQFALASLLVTGLVFALASPTAAATKNPTKAGLIWLTALFSTGSANNAASRVTADLA